MVLFNQPELVGMYGFFLEGAFFFILVAQIPP